MAARRLVIVMVVLLVISAAAAALVPTRESNEDTVGSTETVATEGATASEPAGTKAAIDDAASSVQTAEIKVGGGRKFPVVPIRLGEQLSLVVRSKLADQVEIPALGLIDAVGPGAPARFELFPEEAGDLGVRLANAERVVARIEVRSGARAESDRPGSKNRRGRDRS